MTKPLYEITLKPMEYKVLAVSDVHLIDEEFKNTVGYVEAQEGVILRLIEGAENGVYNTVILLGDLFDRAYKDVAKAFYHISLLEKLHNVLEGRLFKVIGNHPLNKRKNYVPTFFLTGAIKSGRIDKENAVLQATENGLISNYGLSNPIIYAPDRIHVNGNLINLFHFHKTNKNYYDDFSGMEKKPLTHVGCYHDNVMSELAKKYFMELSTGGKFDIPTMETVENSGILKNVDHALIGDIHTKIGEFKVTDTMTGKTTIADIPGTLGRTANHRAQQHNEVNLPLLTFKTNGEVIKEHVRMPLTDYRKIFKVELQEEEKLNRNKMSNFKSAIELLNTPDSFEEAVLYADIEVRTKEIINSILESGSSSISYKSRAKEEGLL